MEEEKGRDVRVCPYCLAEIFAKDYSNPQAWGSLIDFKCPKCDYEGLPVYVYEKDLAKLRNKNFKK